MGAELSSDDHARLALLRELFPDTAADLDTALATHGVTGSGDGLAEVDRWLDEEAQSLSDGALAAVAYGEGAAVARFERAFSAARKIMLGSGLEVPQPEAFAAAGQRLSALGTELERDATLTAVPVPYGLGAQGWRERFAQAGDLGPSPALGLVFATEAEREFDLLDRAPDGVASVPGAGGVVWTLRLVPAGLAPAVLGLSFEHGPHVTLPEMLMLQLMRAVSGEPFVDTRSFTWLAGALAGGKLAARHVYDAQERTVRINCREVGNQGPHLGARPPVS